MRDVLQIRSYLQHFRQADSFRVVAFRLQMRHRTDLTSAFVGSLYWTTIRYSGDQPMSTQLATFNTDDLVKGIDVSHNNGAVDWKNVAAAGVSFAFAKATEGKGFKDPQFNLNY